MAEERNFSVDRLPTLTEVLEVGRELPAHFWTPPVRAVNADVLTAAMPPPDEAELVARVMAQLEPRVAHLLEARLREALAPALARAADVLIRDAKDELITAARTLVQESVVQVIKSGAQPGPDEGHQG